MALFPGDVLDNKYEIVRLLGEGGMGAVFEGRNRLIERRVAIKVLHAAAREAPGVVERFEREARAAGLIGGDHILEVLDLGSLPSGDRYMVMEFLDGETLAQRITRQGRMSPQEIAPLLRQALVGLRGAHAAGIVHRDLKPDNLFILREKAGHKDFLKIIDFGVSKFGGPSSELRMTRTGSVMGTPYYMSPEQAKGAASVNHQSDLYSLGVIAFEAVTGQVPFEGTSFNDLMFKIVLTEMPDIQRVVPGVEASFAAIVRRATAKDLAQRYQSADEFLADVEAYVGRTSMADAPSPSLAQGASHTKYRPEPHVRTHAEWSKTNSDPPSLPQNKSRMAYLVGGMVGLAAAASVAFFWVSRPQGESRSESELAPEVSGVPSLGALPPVPAPASSPQGQPSAKPDPSAGLPTADPSSPSPGTAETSAGRDTSGALVPETQSPAPAAATRPSPVRSTSRRTMAADPIPARVEQVPVAAKATPVEEKPKVVEVADPPKPPPAKPVAADKPTTKKPPASPTRDFGY